MIPLTEDDAYTLLDIGVLDGWKVVAKTQIDEFRWETLQQLVIARGVPEDGSIKYGEYWAVNYHSGKTEMQDDEPFPSGINWYPVRPEKVVTTIYVKL